MVNAAPYMWIFGAIIFIGFFIYLLFIAVDSWGLSSQQSSAKIIDKYYQPPHTTYIMQNVGGRNLTLPQSVDGAYILSLKLHSTNTKVNTIVTKTQYDDAKIGQKLSVSYQESRLIGSIKISSTNL